MCIYGTGAVKYSPKAIKYTLKAIRDRATAPKFLSNTILWTT
jgi:hypothetical protein